MSCGKAARRCWPTATRPTAAHSPRNSAHRPLFAPLDVTDEAAWQKAVATTVDTWGGLHGLLERGRRRRAQLDRGLQPRGLSSGQRGQLDGHVPGLQDRHPRNGQVGRRLDRQHLLGARPARRLLRDGLLRQQGSGTVADQERGDALHTDEVRDPLQLRASGLHRHADDRPPPVRHDRQHDRPAVARDAPSARPARPRRKKSPT